MLSQSYVDELREAGAAAGLDRVGVTSAEPFSETRVVLEQRKAEGLHGGMQFTYRNPARSTDPSRALPAVQSLIVGARSYPTEISTISTPGGDDGFGPLARVARYATGDHYGRLREALSVIADRLREDGWTARVILDDNALVDRAAAERAGLGWFGKNANLLLEGAGSWFVLGSVLTDAPLPADQHRVADGCGTCTRCLDGCPTGAIVSPGVVDARRCLAWLVQAEGVFPRQFRVSLADRIYGCDTCQEVCPPSTRSVRRAPQPSGPDAWVAVLDVLAADDDELLARFGRWYIPRRQPRYLRRNALVVLGNTACVPIADAVAHALDRALADPDPLIRAHAVWAARRLGANEQLTPVHNDPDPWVQAELKADVPERSGTDSGSGGTSSTDAASPLAVAAATPSPVPETTREQRGER